MRAWIHYHRYPISPLIGRIALQDTKIPVGGGRDHDRPMYIPKESMAVMDYYALHRNPEGFGDEFEVFRPERWNSTRPAHWEFPGLGGGYRACSGRQKATLEASYVFGRLA